MDKVLVVEDVQSLREQLKWGLAVDYTVFEAADRPEAMQQVLRHAPKMVLLDLGLPPDVQGTSEGFCCLEWIVERFPDIKIIVLTGNRQRETAHRAVACGAYDYYQKPFDLDELRIVIRRAFHLVTIEERGRRLQEALQRSSAGLEGIAGHCAAMRELLAPLQKVAQARKTAPALTERPAGEDQADLPAEPGEAGITVGHLTLREVRDRVEKSMIHAAVENCGGNMVRASELLGVSRPALYDLMKKHGLFKGVHRP